MFKNGQIVTTKAIFRSIGEANLVAVFWSNRSAGDNPYPSACPRQYLRADGNHEMKLLSNGHKLILGSALALHIRDDAQEINFA